MEFGERVDAPPELKNLPRGATQKTSGKFNNLLLLDKLKIPEHKIDNKKKTLEDERKRVIDAYRALKNRPKL